MHMSSLVLMHFCTSSVDPTVLNSPLKHQFSDRSKSKDLSMKIMQIVRVLQTLNSRLDIFSNVLEKKKGNYGLSSPKNTEPHLWSMSFNLSVSYSITVVGQNTERPWAVSFPLLTPPPPHAKCTVLIFFFLMTSRSSATFAHTPTFDKFDMQLLFDPRSFIHIRILVWQQPWLLQAKT